MFISRKRLNQLEGQVGSLQRELDVVRSFLQLNREGERYGEDSPTMRDLYLAFERAHQFKPGRSSQWVPRG